MRVVKQKMRWIVDRRVAAIVVKHCSISDLEQIREDCALGKEGVSLLGISKAAGGDCTR